MIPAETQATHPYFTAKARAIFAKAGGDPDLAGELAAWAEHNRGADAPENPNLPHGVLVAKDGTLLAETVHVNGGVKRASGTYAAGKDAAHHGIDNLILDKAIGALQRATGQPIIHVTRTEVCFGAGKFIPVV